ncbi:MAG: hypothetical protein Q9184_003225 [Pyrenodesmia sp. 2 TL-2023]
MSDWSGKHPEKARRFASAVSTLVPAGRSADSLADAFNWASLGTGTVVDVGGGTGGVNILLAKVFPSLKFVVQGLSEVIDGAETKVQVEPQPRIEFMAHDFFSEQPVVAKNYLLRAIFHNWPDHYYVRILKSLVPAMTNGARLVINDSVVPAPGTLDLLSERNIWVYDMLMMTLFNVREREREDWVSLLNEADPHFTLVQGQPTGNNAPEVESLSPASQLS